MIDFSFTLLIAAIAGFLFGLTYFTWLWRSVTSLATAKRAPSALLLDAILRFATLAAVVGVLLWLKIAPLPFLFGGLGFFVARLAATTFLFQPARGL